MSTGIKFLEVLTLSKIRKLCNNLNGNQLVEIFKEFLEFQLTIIKLA